MSVLTPLVEHLDYPMFVVTASDDAGPSGCLVGFATQCSIHPPRLLVCLSVQNHTYQVATSATSLGVHLLGEDQHDLASLFGEATGDQVDKFARCRWRLGSTGAPLLEECAAWLEATIASRLALGDHGGFVLDPVDGGAGSHRGQFQFSDAGGFEPGHPA